MHSCILAQQHERLLPDSLSLRAVSVSLLGRFAIKSLTVVSISQILASEGSLAFEGSRLEQCGEAAVCNTRG